MITCPTCGSAVAPSQRFCGNCGTDVRAATSSETPPPPIPPTQPADFYGYEDDYYSVGNKRLSTLILLGLIAAIALVCLCCGLILGLFIPQVWYWIGPVSTVPAPTPTSLIPFAFYG